MNDELLQVESLRVGYGESVVIGSMSLSVAKNEVLAVMGLNGMGKTTLMKAMMGLLPARAGRVRLGGGEITGAAPFRRVGLGLSYVPQGRMVFPTLTVEENIETGLPRRERRIP